MVNHFGEKLTGDLLTQDRAITTCKQEEPGTRNVQWKTAIQPEHLCSRVSKK